MALDQSFEDAAVLGELYGEGAFCFKSKKPETISVSAPSDDNVDDSNFDCNICLDSVQEPVVTLCGHLFCWPCIHKWLDVQSFSSSDEYQRHRQCPVCKSKVSHSTLVPLYGRGRCSTQEEGKTSVPRRPLGPVYRLEMPSSADMRLSERVHFNNSTQEGYYPVSGVMSSNSLSYSAVLDPMMVMVGEMVATRLFGTQVMDRFAYPDTYNLAGTSGPRMRRRIMQADKSLGRIYVFFMCCVLLCLLLF
ncbi:PREDICTED: E3 ubiquitin-protein ligase RMA1-like [Camelina sativa]|uniref:E3 ubiquitin-protein ligase RMA n=1 Tax=Camelina sativa TaxID=90675 RepID=A0ABM0TTH5_CAMSA|nr:PREDICTED: E3 ubiquitin-protein ligase RMA1-like [Camelina sativa]XP_010431123.1 PREDICTED: E3 ubiquitin-protein ligase RMA1-like [Camelina sativa]